MSFWEWEIKTIDEIKIYQEGNNNTDKEKNNVFGIGVTKSI